MIFSHRIQKAISFAVRVHELDQKQKRKGTDIPYITHPLTVGLILAHAGASEHVVIAGILHDALEDSAPTKKVTQADLSKEFGEDVTTLVESVSEADKSVPWAARKLSALEHIRGSSQDSLL